MGLFGDLAKFFLAGREENNNPPTEEDREAAQAADQMMSSDYEEDWNAGVEMGTIPNTPSEYEGENTNPDQKAVRDAPWWRPFLPW